MRGKGCSAEFMHHFEELARKHGWEPGQNTRGVKKPIIQKLSYHFCLQPRTIYDLLRVIDFQSRKVIASTRNNDLPQPEIVRQACRVGNEDTAREIIQQAMSGWPEANVKALHDDIMDLFRDHPEAEVWYRDWRAAHPEARLG